MQYNQNTQAILHIQKDMRLSKCQTSLSVQMSSRRACKDVGDLLKVLKMKNTHKNFKQLKSQREKPIQHDQSVSVDIFAAKIIHEKQRLMSELKKIRKSDKAKAQLPFDILKRLQQKGQGSKIGIYEHLELLGRHQQLRLCKQFRISNEYNQQHIEDLTLCFMHIANISHPIKALQGSNKQRQNSNIFQFREVFLSIAKSKTQDSEKMVNLFQMLSQPQLNNSLVKKSINGQWFSICFELLQQHLKTSPLNPKELILAEIQRILKNASVLIGSQQKQRRFMNEALNQNEFWQKICFLFSKGPDQYALLQHHLKYRQQFLLLQHFTRRVQNRQSSFAPNLALFSCSQPYRQFVMLLQAKYLDYCLKNEKIQQSRMLYVALREISLLHHWNQPYRMQLQYLQKSISKSIYQFKISLILNKPKETIKKHVAQLFTLGQHNIALQLLYTYNKLQNIEYLLLLSTLYNLDIRHSDILLYDHAHTVLSFESLLQSLITSAKSSNLQEIYSLITAFLPCISSTNLQFICNAFTTNQTFFEYVVEVVGIVPAIKGLSIRVDIIEIVMKMIQTSIVKYKNYSYCLQLALTSSLQLYSLPKSAISQRMLTSVKTGSMLITANSQQYQRPHLNIFLNISKQSITNSERIECLFKAYKWLVWTNIRLLKDYGLRKLKYEEMTFINELYIKMSQQQVEGLWKQFKSDQQTIKKYKETVAENLNMILLSFSMLKIKQSIVNRKYQHIVQVLNSLFQESIAESFPNTVLKLQSIYNPSQIKDILLIFIADIVQSILCLKQFKSKVIDRNRTILRYVCKIVHSFLVSIKSNQASAKILFRQLQVIMSQLRTYGDGFSL